MRAESVEEAIAGLQSSGGDGVLVAGGTVIASLINQRLAAPSLLIDIGRISALKSIHTTPDDTLVIGALVTHQDLLRSPQVRAHSPLLTEIAKEISCGRLRARGTLGGSICMIGQQGDPATGLLALDAEVDIEGPRGSRRVPLRRFYRDAFTTDVAADEIVVAIRVQPPPTQSTFAFQKFGPRHAMDFTLLAVAVVVSAPRDTIEDVRIGMNGVAPTAIRATGAEALLRGHTTASADWPAILSAFQEEIAPPGDLIYSEQYKRHLAGVLLQRAITAALAQRPAKRVPK
ncbi:MAG: xanthine dehydrogenase family protein subunit M [Hyphomicrobiales bacterium]|nr:xanthine dehydrogenase family protein subunit M [Hyphomicrobiales bacterium]